MNKKFIKNVLASLLPQAVNIITNLILPGMIIARFGSQINGLTSTVKQIISYVSLVGAGISTAATQVLYSPVAKKDSLTVRGMMKAIGKMFFRCGMIFCIIIFLLSFVYPMFLSGSVDYITTVLLLLVMSISGASEFFVVGKYRAFLYANQKTYVCNVIQGISLLVSLLAAVVLLKFNIGIIPVQFAISAVYVLRALFLHWYIKKQHREILEMRGVEPVMAAVSQRGAAMVHQFSGLAVTGSQAIILSTFVSLEAASIYAIYSIVFYGLISICSNIQTALTPYLGKSIALNEKNQIQARFSAFELLFCVGAAFVFSVTSAMIDPFVSLYTRGMDIQYTDSVFAQLFVLSAFFNVLKLPSQSAINAAGHFSQTKWHAIAEGTICVFVSIVFTILLGKNGVLIGTSVALGWRCFQMTFYANRHIVLQSNKRSLVRMFLAGVTVFCTYTILSFFDLNCSGYAQWCFKACLVACFVLAEILVFFVIPEYKTIKSILKKR